MSKEILWSLYLLCAIGWLSAAAWFLLKAGPYFADLGGFHPERNATELVPPLLVMFGFIFFEVAIIIVRKNLNL